MAANTDFFFVAIFCSTKECHVISGQLRSCRFLSLRNALNLITLFSLCYFHSLCTGNASSRNLILHSLSMPPFSITLIFIRFIWIIIFRLLFYLRELLNRSLHLVNMSIAIVLLPHLCIAQIALIQSCAAFVHWNANVSDCDVRTHYFTSHNFISFLLLLPFINFYSPFSSVFHLCWGRCCLCSMETHFWSCNLLVLNFKWNTRLQNTSDADAKMCLHSEKCDSIKQISYFSNQNF